ncbi:MAG: HAD family hydrolase [Planctomycetota bacterium]
MRYRLAVFDFDGTIADTRTPISLSANRALEELGYPQRSHHDVQQLVGLPLAKVMSGLAGSEEHTDELCAAYRAAFKEFAPDNSPLFEGIRDVLAALHEAGVRMAIATSRSRESLEMFLDQHDLRRFFGFWAGGHCIENGKPHPEMLELVLDNMASTVDETIMVGDTTHDMEMAHAAGMDACAVTYGMHDAERLAACEPTYLVHETRAIPGVVLSHA